MIIIKPTTNLFPQPYKSAGSLNSGKQPASPAKKVISVLSAPKTSTSMVEVATDRHPITQAVAKWTAEKLVSIAEATPYTDHSDPNSRRKYFLETYGGCPTLDDVRRLSVRLMREDKSINKSQLKNIKASLSSELSLEEKNYFKKEINSSVEVILQVRDTESAAEIQTTIQNFLSNLA